MGTFISTVSAVAPIDRNLEDTSLKNKKFLEKSASDYWLGHENKIEIMRLLTPTYYLIDKLRKVDQELASQSWMLIITDAAPNFVENRLNIPFDSCELWFNDILMNRLFEVHPSCRPMFREKASQVNFMGALISFIFMSINNKEVLETRIRSLTEGHNRRGVKCYEYMLVGEVLFWSLHKCLGREYTKDVHKAWCKIFSRLLDMMVPVAAAHEMQTTKFQEDRLRSIPWRSFIADPKLGEDPLDDEGDPICNQSTVKTEKQELQIEVE